MTLKIDNIRTHILFVIVKYVIQKARNTVTINKIALVVNR